MRKEHFFYLRHSTADNIAIHIWVNHVNFVVKGNASPLHPLALFFFPGYEERVLGHNQRSSITRGNVIKTQNIFKSKTASMAKRLSMSYH